MVTQQSDELSVYRYQKKLKDLWISQLAVQTVLDVGANLGQFSSEIRRLLPDVNIYAFEPLPDCFAKLQSAFSGDPHFHAFNIGLGEVSGEMAFERNQFSVSSSFLEKTEAHTGAFPFTADTSKEMVKVDRLDAVAENLNLAFPLLLKIDVQGFEDRVLRGGEVTARKAQIILLETSFVELYKNQPLFDDIYTLLRGWGFAYQGSFEPLRDPRSGEIVQEDSVFVRC
jgi:FkbM family methyltransferase